MPYSSPYVPLAVSTNFTFLAGASHGEELVARAAELNLPAIAVADANTLAGIVRAHVAAKQSGLGFIVGTRLVFRDGAEALCFPHNRRAYGRVCRLLTLGRRRAPKGECHLDLADLLDYGEGCDVVLLPSPAIGDGALSEAARQLSRRFGRYFSIGADHAHDGNERRHLAALADLSSWVGAPLVATPDIRMHDPARRRLFDVMTCIRNHVTIDEAGLLLSRNAERYLKPAQEISRLYAGYEGAVARTAEIAGRAQFSLDELRYEYPVDVDLNGETPQQKLVRRTWEGARDRYPRGIPIKVRDQIEYELGLIGALDYAPYFLTVDDIVRFARHRQILCQGRGSAANSAVCFALGITSVDPARIDLLFERFVSAERNEPPDIDVDFEHERREEVIQFIYQKYGRNHAGLAATVICYRTRSALREIGKAMGLPLDVTEALSGTVWGQSSRGVTDDRVRELGLDPEAGRLRLALDLSRDLIGFPRHLSQHVGGFVLTRGPLDELVPIENAAMEDRTIIQWDKDDLDAVGLLKVDVLGLGMLSCIRRSLDLLAVHGDRPLTLAEVPAEDPAVYDMLGEGDSVGVFQVESRAQMTMLPRLKPRNFYDLVVEVAIVRPGPIQGDMVHPYLRRRNGEEAVEYPSDDLRQVLEKTLGVPLFQEQAMKIAIVAAGFTPGEADRLRRAMATFKRTGTVAGFRDKMIQGMTARGYDPDFAERCFRQIEGFGEYGFPESHAASFALLVYVSAWLKCHYPAHFAAALLNSQPMGFYAPAQIVRDAREHGVTVRPVDVNHSGWDCTLEPFDGDPASPRVALRLGLRQVSGLNESEAGRLIAARRASKSGAFADMRDLWLGAGLQPGTLDRLASADAFTSLGLSRRDAFWAVRGLGPPPPPLFAARPRQGAASADMFAEPAVALPAMSLGEEVAGDYRSVGLSLRRHPVALLRGDLPQSIITNDRLASLDTGTRVTVSGLVFCRQRPGTANGVIFLTVEDETGVANLIVWPKVMEKYRGIVIGASLVVAAGRLQRQGKVVHIVVEEIEDCSALLDLLARPLLNDLDAAGETPKKLRKRGPFRDRNALQPAGSNAGERPRPSLPHKLPRSSGYRSRDFH